MAHMGPGHTYRHGTELCHRQGACSLLARPGRAVHAAHAAEKKTKAAEGEWGRAGRGEALCAVSHLSHCGANPQGRDRNQPLFFRRLDTLILRVNQRSMSPVTA